MRAFKVLIGICVFGFVAAVPSPELSDHIRFKRHHGLEDEHEVIKAETVTTPLTTPVQLTETQPHETQSVVKTNDHIPTTKEIVDVSTMCLEPGCIHAASAVLGKMDLTQNPCDDFYQFACGKFVQEKHIPDEETAVNTFQTLRDDLREKLRQLLDSPYKETDIDLYKNVKKYYKMCLNKTAIEQKGEKPLLHLLEVFGGYPVLDDNWDESNFSWVQLNKKYRQMGVSVDYMFDLSISTDFSNSSRRRIEFDQPGFNPSREFVVRGRNDSTVIAYYEYIRDLAVILGASMERATRDMSDVVDFEVELAKITAPKEARRNATLLNNPMALEELQRKYTWLDWYGYISAILPPDVTVSDTDMVNIVDVKFFEQLGGLLDKTSKRTIANFMLTRLASGAVKYLTNRLRQRQQEFKKAVYGQAEEQARWKECVSTTVGKLPNAVSALYVRKYFNTNSKQTALDMVNDLKLVFEDNLKEVEWMDDVTRKEALKKLNSMSTLIGYPEELDDDQFLANYYKDVQIVENNYLESSFKIFLVLSDISYRQLREPVIKNEWRTWAKAAEVNAFYNRVHNHIRFPAGILQGHFFSADRPKYLNYGAIGSVIGHEITHGFDDQGRQFDGDGNLNDWWAMETSEAFKQKAQCLIDQYSSVLDAQTNLTLNGIITQGENIADNGGIQISYIAYQRYVKRNGEEPRLPGLQKFNAQQMFWIAMSQNWCSLYRDEALKISIARNAHPPSKYRVLLPLQNNKAFARDFNCPINSPMNPEKKCLVW